MLRLRTAIGLTQDGMAKYLGVSRRAVGEWEAGNSYPKAQHLKELIALGVKQQAWTKGAEAEEIRALWKVARQKVILDERWLSALLNQKRSPHLRIVPETAEESESPTQVMAEVLPEPREPVALPQVDWGDALATSTFYGREEELAKLTQWVVQEHCRVVSLLGIGGIGKSALAVSLMYRLASHFEVVIFRSLRDVPACEVLLDDCLHVLAPQSLEQPNPERRINLLLSHFHKTRVLLVLDNLEGLLKEGDTRGHFRPGFEQYRLLLNRVAETSHQSCLLITSRERPAELRYLESQYSQVRSLRLLGLDTTSCQCILEEMGLARGVGISNAQDQLIVAYSGNPLALKIVAGTIVDLFDSEIGAFLTVGGVIFGSITDLLEEHFARLSPLEQSILCWLAIAHELMTLDDLLAVLVKPLPRVQVFEAIDSLRRRSLIEPGQRPGSFTVQSVVLEYVTAHLVAEGCHEIKQNLLRRLIEHGLSQAHAKEYVRQAQERLLVVPLLAELQSIYLHRVSEVIGTSPVEEQLLSLLDELREKDYSAQGYGPANLIALLRVLRGHLSGLDLSQLSIRGASLQGVEMQETTLCRAMLRETTWTSASMAWSVAISPDGRFWAVGGRRGEIRVWREGGRTLHRLLQAHTGLATVLAFSPNGRWLSSGGRDETVKLWDVEHGARLWINRDIDPLYLAFSPDGSLLACSGLSRTVRIWETKTGTNLQNLEHPAQTCAIAWSPDGRRLVSSCTDGQLRFWERQQTEPLKSTEFLRLVTSWQTSPVRSLAFAPNGETLVGGGSWDRMLRLWEVGSGRLLHTFEGETNRTSCVAFSPDGRTLASGSCHRTIWLWDVKQRRHRATLSGHTSEIYEIAFTPDSSHLLSTSEDNTLRMWDTESGQCVRVLQGYAVAYSSLDWNPDGRYLWSGDIDGVVSIWDTWEDEPPRALHGHTSAITGVGWSPDGRLVASCGWDAVVRLWSPTSGVCVQSCNGPPTALCDLDWSPDGSLLAVGNLHGVYVWDVREGRCHFTLEPDQAACISVGWSPDGSLLAGGSNDGSVYLWDGADGTLLQRLQGHHGTINKVAWSPDGTLLVSGSNRELFVWDVQSSLDKGDCQGSAQRPSLSVQTVAEHFGAIYALAWSRSAVGRPPRDWLISGGNDGLLRWWDIQSGECVCMREGHQGRIRTLKVSPDGKRLASCGDDGAIRIWDVESGGHLRTLRRGRPYERLNITEIRGLTEAEIESLRALGAIEEV
jgi:WD40 repeat protein/transcriptional regulator with XRE-family HTH domain